MKPRQLMFATLSASALVLSACAVESSALLPTEPQQTSGPEPTAPAPSGEPSGDVVPIDAPMPEIPSGLEEFYGQDLTWEECDSFECADITVPLDYDDPGGETITVAMLKRPADESPIGSLFVNPGGPGGSGKGVAESAEYYFDENIRANFDIVGFDPRGVGDSTPIDCVDDATLDKLLDAAYDESEDGWEEKYEKDLKTITDGCDENSGGLLAYVGTPYAAQDIDVMRHLVGDPKLYYKGFSYGTFLGGEYADLFPENVGRLILDGAVDPTLGLEQMSYDQTLGFEVAYERYMEDCLAGGTTCPFDGTVDEGLEQVHDIFEASLKEPIPTSDPDRPLTQSQLFGGMIMPMYEDALWPQLSQAFDEVINDGTGDLFQMFNDLSNERNDDGTFETNGTEANWAINCADYGPGSGKDGEELSEKIKDEAPVFGSYMTEGESMCANWAYQPAEQPDALTAQGSDMIVVVGTRYDPATPYHWSEAMNEDFDNSVLVTWEGDGHTAYSRADSCINDPLNAYLLAGTVPQDGLTCEK
ncbi:MAG: alpha/beta hydrolase [Ancrocorticia sp.]|uniref:alpha/beta hydrolase n=1 Tax=Ancrocorticia sp. TaxID=2593684 RepID=UPI003F8E4E43